MNPATFEQVMGHKPERDDLERANCNKAGQAGHTACGVCEHDRPVFMCPECFVRCSGHGAPVVYKPQLEGPDDY